MIDSAWLVIAFLGGLGVGFIIVFLLVLWQIKREERKQ